MLIYSIPTEEGQRSNKMFLTSFYEHLNETTGLMRQRTHCRWAQTFIYDEK